MKIEKKIFSFSGGMGLTYGATPDFTDYLRQEIPYSNSDSISTFNAGIEFFGAVEYEFTKDFSAKIDYSYFVRSFRYEYFYFVYDYTITSHQPFLFINYKLLKSPNYNFKLGLGLGYHFQQLDNKVSDSLAYTSNGPGIRAELTFSPKFSKRFWGCLSGFAYGNFYGKLEDKSGNILKPTNSNFEAALGGYGVGVRLGFTVYLN
ncbi:MAG: hypothetical protein L0Y79_06335 [Chlorobi bacterium]|nr:hypothetical protein [Chlorobiota bacterium]MCI0717087.1 hypothetical protein [Chlorobiota bacterium]